MKRLLIIPLMLVVLLVVTGLYQGWFTVSSPDGKQDSKTNINLEIDGGKIREDAEALSTKAMEMKDNVTGHNRGTDGK